MFENTPESSRERYRNLGRYIDIIAGPYDEAFLHNRGCSGLELSKVPIRCAIPVSHRLAIKDSLTVQDLYGESLMLIRRGWNRHADALRDDLTRNHKAVNIVDFQFYNVSVFNQCENNNCALMTIDVWENVHPLLKILPVDWEHTIPFGILHPISPSKTVQRFLDAIKSINL